MWLAAHKHSGRRFRRHYGTGKIVFVSYVRAEHAEIIVETETQGVSNGGVMERCFTCKALPRVPSFNVNLDRDYSYRSLIIDNHCNRHLLHGKVTVVIFFFFFFMAAVCNLESMW